MRIKWSMKQITLAALACTAIGLVGLAYLFQQGVFNKTFVPVDMEQVLDGSKVQSFSIKTDIEDLTFVQSSSNELRIRLTGEVDEADLPNTNINVDKGNGSDVNVVITKTRPISIGIDVRQAFQFFSRKLTVTVELPDKVYKSLKARSDTGDITLSAVRADKLELTSDTGEITLAGFTGSKLAASSDTGSIRLEHVSAQLDLESDTGHIMVELDDLPGAADISSDTGDIEISLNKAVPLEMDFATDTGKTSAKADGADMTLQEKRRLKGKLSGGGPLIKARSDTGDIQLYIK
jgi:hypothetical protein